MLAVWDHKSLILNAAAWLFWHYNGRALLSYCWEVNGWPFIAERIGCCANARPHAAIWVWRHGLKIMDHSPYNGLHSFGPHKKRLSGRRVVIDVDVK